MEVDIRFPIGLMFSILGVLLTLFGLISNGNEELYQRSLGVNVNLWSGLGMLVFGLLMLFLAFKAKAAHKESNP
jgi:hypothetical protein